MDEALVLKRRTPIYNYGSIPPAVLLRKAENVFRMYDHANASQNPKERVF